MQIGVAAGGSKGPSKVVSFRTDSGGDAEGAMGKVASSNDGGGESPNAESEEKVISTEEVAAALRGEGAPQRKKRRPLRKAHVRRFFGVLDVYRSCLPASFSMLNSSLAATDFYCQDGNYSRVWRRGLRHSETRQWLQNRL